MTLFMDRREAGIELASLLHRYAGRKDTIVVGLARGGVVTAAPVAAALGVPIDTICPRKLGAPDNEEFAIGAVTEYGESMLNKGVIESLGIPCEYVLEKTWEEAQKAQRRLARYRLGLPERDLNNKVVILVDDGLATGHTMLAAIKTAKKEGAKKIVLAFPVAPMEAFQRFQELADECYCLATPEPFFSIGAFYQHFGSTTDHEVVEILQEGAERPSAPDC